MFDYYAPIEIDPIDALVVAGSAADSASDRIDNSTRRNHRAEMDNQEVAESSDSKDI